MKGTEKTMILFSLFGLTLFIISMFIKNWTMFVGGFLLWLIFGSNVNNKKRKKKKPTYEDMLKEIKIS